MFRRPDEARGGGLIDIRMVEQAGFELADQDAFHRPVQDGLADPALSHGLLELRIAVCAQVHVHAGVQGQFARFLAGRGHVVAGLEPVDALQVTDDETVEAPFVPQDAGQEILVAGGGNAVQGVV